MCLKVTGFPCSTAPGYYLPTFEDIGSALRHSCPEREPRPVDVNALVHHVSAPEGMTSIKFIEQCPFRIATGPDLTKSSHAGQGRRMRYCGCTIRGRIVKWR